MRICLPDELLADIVEILFQQCIDCRERVVSRIIDAKPHWSCVHNVTLASRTLRAIGLRLWFSRLMCVFHTSFLFPIYNDSLE